MINDLVMSEIRKILKYYTGKNKLGSVNSFDLEGASLAILRLVNNPPENPKEEDLDD